MQALQHYPEFQLQKRGRILFWTGISCIQKKVLIETVYLSSLTLSWLSTRTVLEYLSLRAFADQNHSFHKMKVLAIFKVLFNSAIGLLCILSWLYNFRKGGLSQKRYSLPDLDVITRTRFLILLVGSFCNQSQYFLDLWPELLASVLMVLKALAIFKVLSNSANELGASTASLSRVSTWEERPLPVLFLTWIQFARDRVFLSNEWDFLPAHASSTVLMFWQNDMCHKRPFFPVLRFSVAGYVLNWQRHDRILGPKSSLFFN